MLHVIAKAAPIIASTAAVIVAGFVYRLNSEKLFLDMLAARREAVREVLEAAAARDDEITGLPTVINHPSAYNLPAQARFWRAANAAEGLFGPEVGDALSRLDRAMMEKIGAVLELRAPSEELAGEASALRRHAFAVGDLLDARQAFALTVVRYTHLGRRGLTIRDRWALWSQDRRKRRGAAIDHSGSKTPA